MAYVDGFEHDVFLSCSPVDDEAPAGERGWVSAFEEYLRIALEQRVGERVKVWRKPQKIDDCAVFVALTSRGYLASESCRRELAHFYRRASSGRCGLTIGDRLRIVNVLLTNVDPGDWPSEFGDTIGFDFHDAEREDETGLPSEPGCQLFKQQLRALADALFKLFKAMKNQARGRVFLADVSHTLRDQHRRLAEELQRKRIKVDSGVQLVARHDHDRRVVDALERADLSVHLFDGGAGREIAGRQGLTYPRRQLELAGEHARSRMVWLPRDLDLATIEDAAYGELLQGLERGEGGGACDLIRGIRADLASQILDKVPPDGDGPKDGKDSGASCLLVNHTKDTAHMLPVANTLMSEGIEPYINSEMENEPKEALDLFEHRLRQVASLIIFYGAVRREWVRERIVTAAKTALEKDLDLRLAVYAAPPEKPLQDVSFSRGPIHVETLASADEALAFVGV